MKAGRRFQLRLLFASTGLIANVARDHVPEPYQTGCLLLSAFFIGWGMMYFAVFPWGVDKSGNRGVIRFTWDMYRDLKLPTCPHCGNGIEKGQTGAAAHAILKGGARACSVNTR